MMIDHQDKYVEQHIEISISSSFPPLIILTSALFVLISVSFLSSSFCPQIIVISSSGSFSFCLQIILISSSISAASSHWHGSPFFGVVFGFVFFCICNFVFVSFCICLCLQDHPHFIVKISPLLALAWFPVLCRCLCNFVFFCLCVFLSLSLCARSSSFPPQDQLALAWFPVKS